MYVLQNTTIGIYLIVFCYLYTKEYCKYDYAFGQDGSEVCQIILVSHI